MEFLDYVLNQALRHPSMMPRDAGKLCFQAAFGAEHLLQDRKSAWEWLKREAEETVAAPGPLAESISEDVCRLNLSAWKFEQLPFEWLFRLFAPSVPRIVPSGEEDFRKRLAQIGFAAGKGTLPFSGESWEAFLSEYWKDGLHPVHHSEAYREAERPAYRVVSAACLRLLPLLKKLARLPEQEVRVVALDGRAAAGKTTAAAMLGDVLHAGVVHTDDFFLPPELRTPLRFAMPGGNFHYERFREEILPRIASSQPFSYRVFDCGEMTLRGERVVCGGSWRIVEGSYSCHERLGPYMSLRAFADINPDEQLRRIRVRNPELAGRFAREWIPLEESYFRAAALPEQADCIL